MTSTYYDDEEKEGFEVTDEFEADDMTDQVGGTIPAARKVLCQIKKASLKIQREFQDGGEDDERNPIAVRRLTLQCIIGPQGTDGRGSYAGRMLFPEFILWRDLAVKKRMHEADDRNRKPFNVQWWTTEYGYPTKDFLSGMGIPAKGLKVNDDFLIGLQGRHLTMDIVSEKDKMSGGTRNKFQNFKQAEVETPAVDEE